MGRKLIVVAAIALLSGCAQTPGKGNLALVGPLPSAGIVAVTPAHQAVVVADVPPAGAVALGPVEGRSCKNSLLDPAPTRENALLQLREKAAALGATGIHSVTYGTDKNPIGMNCWATIRATAVAFKNG